MTEFHVAFQYKLSSKENPSKEDYSELAWITADLFDYIFRSYFLDIEEVTFEEVDRLPIYSVKGPTYVDFTLAAYFGPDSSLPTESQLTDISLISLHEGSAYYQYYLQLLQSLESDSPFRTVERVQLYKYSALTGPGEMSEPATPRNTTRVFMVVIPIVILVVAIVVATLIYISWMESQDASSNEDATVNKRKLGEQSDGEQTIPSEGGISFSNQYRSDFDDDVLRQLSTSKKAKKVRHSPRVIRRTFNDDEFSAKIGFEEVSLGDDHDHDEAYYDQKDDDTDDSTAEAEQTQVATNGDSRGVTISALMNEFSQVLDRAPTTVRRFPAPEKKSLLKNDGTSESRIEIEPKKDVSFTSLGSTVDLNGDKYATIEDDVTDDSVVDEMEDNHCSTDDAIETSEPYLEEEVLEDGDFEYEEETVESISTEIKECPHDDGKATTKVEENKSIPTSIQTESTEKASDEIEESGTSSPKEEEEKCTESTGEDKPEVPDVPSGSGLRNFWEQKTAKKGSLHDFWEQKAKGKST